MDGFLILDKPVGPTSHDMVATVRRVLKKKKVGHTGTLDPFATGVLPVAIGEATKAIPYLDESVKEYQAVMCLGVATDTQDATGRILGTAGYEGILEELLLEVFARFTGTISQTPPMFSAVKQGGVPLYRRARQGEEVERTAREITVHSLSIDAVELPLVTFTVVCSRGTYVRTLAADIGEVLGCGAHLKDLRRLRSGPFDEHGAVSLETLQKLHDEGRVNEILITPYQALSHLRDLELNHSGAKKVGNGIAPGEGDFRERIEVGLHLREKVRLSLDGKLLAVAENGRSDAPDSEKTIRLLRVFS
ncbi:MAG: tRNA pseudouridine(55) synthase TruB [Deltaproteobacteria bacterium]|nr:tRNA pseudouridine(55) synthase TruB [Deltaproteobacteria bacterium]